MKCSLCNIIFCFYCYISTYKNNFYVPHFHYIYARIENEQKLLCDNCKSLIKIRYRCSYCEFNLCDICIKNLINCQNLEHNHNLILSKKNLNCYICNEKKNFFMSCYNLDCNYYDRCLNCYFKNSKKIFNSIDKLDFENIPENEIILSQYFILPHYHKAIKNNKNTIIDINCEHCNNNIDIRFYCPDCCLTLCEEILKNISSNNKKQYCDHYLIIDKKNENNFYSCRFNKSPQKENHSNLFMVCNKCKIYICLNCFVNKE